MNLLFYKSWISANLYPATQQRCYFRFIVFFFCLACVAIQPLRGQYSEEMFVQRTYVFSNDFELYGYIRVSEYVPQLIQSDGGWENVEFVERTDGRWGVKVHNRPSGTTWRVRVLFISKMLINSTKISRNEDGLLQLRDLGDVGKKNLVIGDDSYLTDVDIQQTLGVFGNTDSEQGAIKLGSNGPVLHGKNLSLGIGSTNPGEKLHVEGGIYASDKVRVHGGNFQSSGWMKFRADTDNSGDDDFLFTGKDNVEFMRLTGGKLGIGMHNPQYKLDVDGIINADGLRLNGEAFTSGYWSKLSQNVYFPTGNVGVGVDNPSARLTIDASSSNSPDQNGLYVYNSDQNKPAIVAARVSGSGDGDPFLSLDVQGVGGWAIGMDNSDGDKLKIAPGWASLHENTSLTIDRSGKIGVGEVAPLATLHVADSGVPGSKNLMVGDDSYFTDLDYQGLLGLYGSNNAAIGGLRLGEGGGTIWGKDNKIGVGTEAPDAKLHIADNDSPAGTKDILVGDDSYLSDLDYPDLMGIYGNHNASRGGLKLGSTGGTLWGINNNVGIGLESPEGQLHIADLGDPGQKNLIIGDDAFLSDIDEPNMLAVRGVQNENHGGLMLGKNGLEVWGVANKIGLGTKSPEGQLHIADLGDPGHKNLIIGDDLFFTDIDGPNSIGIRGLQDETKAGLKLGSGGTIIWGTNDKIGIGTDDPDYKLHVNGRVKAEGVILNVGSFPDYVFASGYDLMSLSELQTFINKNKHLPKMPSEAEVLSEGADLGRINILLVEKIEEMTLYTLEQEQKLSNQQQQIDQLIQQLQAMQAQVNQLTKK